MTKKDIEIADAIKRKKWKNGYHLELRDKKGRWIKTARWNNSKSKEKFINELTIEQRRRIEKVKKVKKVKKERKIFFQPDTRFAYTVKAFSTKLKENRFITISSETYPIDRKEIFDYIMKRYEDYNFEIKSLKLMRIYDRILGESLFKARK